MIELSRDGFEPIGDRREEDLVVEPGTLDLRIVLERAPRTEFRVIDAATLEPVESFWLGVFRHGGSGATRPIHGGAKRGRARPQPGGIVTADAAVGRDRVNVSSPGYLEHESDVEHDSPGGGVQTILLSRGATVTGRVFSEGAPAADVEVAIEGRSERSIAKVRTDAEGKYELVGVGRGTHGLVATVRGDTLTARTQVTVDLLGAAPAAIEAPDLHLTRPGTGTIQGKVLLPPDVPPDGLIAYHGRWSEARRVPVRSDGTFTLEDVPEGRCVVHLGGGQGLLKNAPPTEVEVPANGVALATIDAARAGVATLSLTVEIPGMDLDGVSFFVEHDRTIEDPDERYPFSMMGKIATNVGPDGRAEVETRASGTAFIELNFPDRTSVVLYDQPVTLEPGGFHEQRVRYVPTTLEMEIPEPWLAEDIEHVFISLWTEGQYDAVWRGTLARPAEGGVHNVSIEGNRAHVPNAPAGRFRLEVAAAGPTGWIKAPEGTVVEIREGESNRITLPGPAGPR